LKILSPLSSTKETLAIINRGADEIYCGVIDNDITRKYNLPIFNRRPYSQCNLNSISELKDVVNKSHSNGVSVFVALNVPIYKDKQFDAAEEIIEKMILVGIDALIVSDLGLIHFINEKNFNIKTHISTCASIYNNFAIEFFKSLGASRVIFPRHISIDEIKNLTSKIEGMEYEILAMNTKCPYDDGYCTFEHNLSNFTNNADYQGGGCGSIQNVKMHTSKNSLKEEHFKNIIYEYKRRKNNLGKVCAGCAIAKLTKSKVKIHSLKIVGREFKLEKKLKDIEFFVNIRKLINMRLEDEILKRQIKDMYFKIYGLECNNRCYY
jgi:putative protease